MPSLSPTTPMLPSYNPVRRLSIPYHIKTQGLFRRSSCDTATSHDEDGEDHLLSNGSRERKSGFRKLCGYVFLALLSLLVGLIAGHFIRVEDKLNGYMSMLDPLPRPMEKSKCVNRMQNHTTAVLETYKKLSGTRTVLSPTRPASSLKPHGLL
jgi:hypothetical protein